MSLPSSGRCKAPSGLAFDALTRSSKLFLMSSTTVPSRWKAALLLVLIFCLGAACGVGGGLLVLRRIVRHAIANPTASGAPVDRLMSHLESELAAELDLTPAERAAIHADLQQAGAEFKTLRQDLWLRTGANARQTLQRMAAHLPADKAAKLEAAARRRLEPWGLQVAPPP